MKARPGITIPELAEAMGIKQNYLYRVMPGLAEEGKVTKSGRGWQPKRVTSHGRLRQVRPGRRSDLRAKTGGRNPIRVNEPELR